MRMRNLSPMLVRLAALAVFGGAACTANVAPPVVPGSLTDTLLGANTEPKAFRIIEPFDQAPGKPGRMAFGTMTPGDGLKVEDFEFVGGLEVDDAGSVAMRGAGLVAVAGSGEHAVVWEELDRPVMSQEFDQVTVTDKATENKRTYGADQAMQRYFAADGAQRVDIAIDPGGFWLVNGQPAPDTRAAAKLALQSPVVREASLHALTALCSVLQKVPRAETRGAATCVREGCLLGPIPPDPVPLLLAIIELKQASDKAEDEAKAGPPPVMDEPADDGLLICPPDMEIWAS